MAQEIVITSVRKGLDGGSGYQPVLRTRGMKPAVAERLQIRSGYSHPYPFGDPRNPVVFIHRIERVAGQTLSVLGRICDAGSDHTGRSNFLAHLTALDDTEARRKTAGPADVARRFAFKTSWNEQPREADSPPVIGGDRSPAACAAWRAAGLDPGLAGDLAEAAARGQEMRLIVRQSDDVLALFADAIALLPPANRWQVTFNTCEIESFDAVWRAIRDDLPQARAWRGSPGVIDLTHPGTRGSDSVYARFARGEANSLPWQHQASEVTSSSTEITASSPQVATPVEPSLRTKPAHSNAEAIVPPAAPPGHVDAAPPPPDAPPTPSAPKKRNYLEGLERPSLDGSSRDDGTRPRSNVLWLATLAAAVVMLLTLAGGFLAISLNKDLSASLATFFRGLDDSEETQVALSEKGQADEESISLGEDAQAERRRHKEEEARKKQEADETARVAEEKRRKQKAAEDARIAEEQQQQAQAARAQAQANSDQLHAKQVAAFAALQKLEGITEQDLPLEKMGDGTPRPSTVCSLDADNLVDLALDLAIPRDNADNEEPFHVTITPVPDKALTWEVSSQGGVVDEKAKPTALATIFAKDRRLSLQPASHKILANKRFNHLRCSALLIKARNPDQHDNEGNVVKAIQLVRPVPSSQADVYLIEPQSSLTLRPPPGISADNVFPSKAVVEYEIAYGFGFDASPSKEVHKGKWQTGGSPFVFVPLLHCPAAPPRPLNPPTILGLRVGFANGLSQVTFSPRIEGPAEQSFQIDEIRKYIRASDADFLKQLKLLQIHAPSVINPYRVPVDRVDVNKLRTFLKQHEQELKNFLQPDSYDEWTKECMAILTQAANVPRVGITPPQFELAMTPIRSKWQETFVTRLDGWAKERASKMQNDLSHQRQYFKPLQEPACFVVRTITTQAHSKDNNEYAVRLVSGSAPDTPLTKTRTPTPPKPIVN